jgi:hypothetical protein
MKPILRLPITCAILAMMNASTSAADQSRPELACVPGNCRSIVQRAECAGVLMEYRANQPSKQARDVYADLSVEVLAPVGDVILSMSEPRKREALTDFVAGIIENGREMAREGHHDLVRKACDGLVDEGLLFATAN